MNVQCVCGGGTIIWISYNHLKLVTWATTAHLIYPYNTVATHRLFLNISFQTDIRSKKHILKLHLCYFL